MSSFICNGGPQMPFLTWLITICHITPLSDIQTHSQKTGSSIKGSANAMLWDKGRHQ